MNPREALETWAIVGSIPNIMLMLVVVLSPAGLFWNSVDDMLIKLQLIMFAIQFIGVMSIVKGR